MNRIALFLPNWVGDVVMATPAIRAVHAAYPAAELLAVCKPYVADVVAGAPWFRDVVRFDKSGPRGHRFWSVARRLRAERIDAALLFPNSFRAALLARLGGCGRVVGFRRYGRGFLLSAPKLDAQTERGRFVPTPVIDDYNRLAVALGAAEPGHRMELFTTPADEAAADAVWQQFGLGRYGRVVLLNPGAAFGAAKFWPGDSFAALGLTKAAVRRAGLLVTTDSGPRHFAAAFDRPVVTLFGPTHLEWTETYFPKAANLRVKVPCGPCQRRVCPLDHRCMTGLTPDAVFAAAAGLLGRSSLPQVTEVRRAG